MRLPAACLLVAIAGCGGAGCGSAEEEAQPVAPPSVLTAAAAGTDAAAPPATAVEVAEPQAPTEPPDVGARALTVAATGLGWGEPRPAPVVDAADCARRWNGAPNVEARRATAPGASGAFVDLEFDGEARCSVWVVHGDAMELFAEVRSQEFGQAGGGAGGLGRPPDWYVHADGTLEGPLDPLPLRATIASGGAVATAGTGSYCWDEGSGSSLCADSPAPACGDGLTPRLDLATGDPVGLTLAFEPVAAPLLTLHGPGGQPTAGEPVELERTSSPSWVADLGEGEHAVSVFVRAPDAKDVTYTACLHVGATASAPAFGEPLAAVSAASLHRTGVGAHAAGDEATCMRRWNDGRNAVARTEVAAVRHGGAFVRAAIAGIPTCAVYVLRPGVETGADVFVQGAGGAFVLAAPGHGLLRPPEWWLDAEARLQPTLPEPPPASVTTADGRIVAGFGTYCWSSAGCVDKLVPGCGDGWTPHVASRAAGPVRFGLPFTPVEAPVLTLHGGPEDGRQATLDAADPVWRLDVPPGRHAVSLFVRAPQGGDVAYTACLDVVR